MSSTTLKLIYADGSVKEHIVFKNGHGFGPYVYSAISQKALGGEHVWAYDGGKTLWPLWEDPTLPTHWKFVLGSTYDHAYIEAEHFAEMAAMYRQFVRDFWLRTGECHLTAIAAVLDTLALFPNSGIIGVAFHAHSSGADLWADPYDEDTDVTTPYNLHKDEHAYGLFERLKEQLK